ncbi:hypothetical protein FQA39_LY03291 [Lamprigera yunnana]|nr:hypothetical protein FQA39_LY03291 [Lamprigera yunnana]
METTARPVVLQDVEKSLLEDGAEYCLGLDRPTEGFHPTSASTMDGRDNIPHLIGIDRDRTRTSTEIKLPDDAEIYVYINFQQRNKFICERVKQFELANSDLTGAIMISYRITCKPELAMSTIGVEIFIVDASTISNSGFEWDGEPEESSSIEDNLNEVEENVVVETTNDDYTVDGRNRNWFEVDLGKTSFFSTIPRYNDTVEGYLQNKNEHTSVQVYNVVVEDDIFELLVP